MQNPPPYAEGGLDLPAYNRMAPLAKVRVFLKLANSLRVAPTAIAFAALRLHNCYGNLVLFIHMCP